MSKKLLFQEKVFSIVVFSIAAILIISLYNQGHILEIKILLFFGLLTFIAENFCINLPQVGAVSVSSTIIIATTIIFGPLLGALTAIFNAVVWRDIKERTSPFWWLFNGSQGAISAGVAGLTYLYLGGDLLVKTEGFLRNDFPYILVPIIASSIAFFLVNSILFSLSISISESVSPLVIWRANIFWAIPNYFSLIPLALAFAQIYMTTGMIGLILMFIPLLVARQTFQVYGKLKNTYMETVKALVAALEAKDPYTRGHSERVSQLAENIGRLLKLGADDLEKLRYAGVLHDIGKIGTAKYILRKPGNLSEEEYARVKKHPETGALILREIKLLEKVIPAVFHHHERYDGSGYADGFKGEEIPLLARVMSVADSYDAMTSPRPYRPAMSKELACQELLACSGTQFDPKIVEVFVDSLEIDFGNSQTTGGTEQLRLDEFTPVKNSIS